GFSGLRYRFIPSLRFGTGFASPYNPCHSLKLKNSKLNLLDIYLYLLLPTMSIGYHGININKTQIFRYHYLFSLAFLNSNL
ncbi:MAG: hypothetical protein PUJ82_11180, partial [Spirochaetales bacterium]|nr:hypothetical protein [Spirochaetales bacterium]